ncbi:hypothetical protein M5D96_006530 [Drosophila gunungcola]|uniref:Uncharacterized protein n=1 Tax=Drosophila gunungcola TaxID=103775 RepID=A0A9P9YPB9_9MUSC|nr:hypothetical protein M5D96_006530 [Drosophila gunungcola]
MHFGLHLNPNPIRFTFAALGSLGSFDWLIGVSECEMLLLLLVVLLVVAGWIVHLGQADRRRKVANLPGPVCPPLIGALQLALRLNPKTFLELGREYVSRYGHLQRIWIFNRLLIMSGDAELNEQLLSSQEHLVKHPVYKVLGQWLGNGLLLSDGKVWHQRRKIITPTCTALLSWRFMSVYLQVELLFTLTHPHLKWRQTQLIRTMQAFTIKVIEQRRQALEDQQKQSRMTLDTADEDVGSKRRMALLDVLLMSSVDGKPLTNDEIREEVDTFMFEGT